MALKNGTRLVLIEKLDRLARDLMIQETIIADLQHQGFQLISAAEPDLLKDDPTRKLMRQMMGAIAEYEKAMTVAKLRVARERKRQRTGRCEGRKPYGHREGERETIERMKVLRREGRGYDSIAAILTAEGTTTRKGTPWHAAGVRRVLLRNVRNKAGSRPIAGEPCQVPSAQLSR